MAFTIPAAIVAFFGKYPDANPVYVLANGKAYINHYSAQALEAAKAEGIRLYEVDSASTSQQIYPETKTYEGIAKKPALTAICNDETLGIPDGDVSEDVKNAFNMVAEEANIIISSIAVATHETLFWKITIVSEEANFKCKQDGGDIIDLLEIPA